MNFFELYFLVLCLCICFFYRTLVGDPPEDIIRLSDTSDSPDYQNVSSPEDNQTVPVSIKLAKDIL